MTVGSAEGLVAGCHGRKRTPCSRAVLTGRWTMTETCARFGISRKTGYEVMALHAERGVTGLLDASQAPKSIPTSSRLARWRQLDARVSAFCMLPSADHAASGAAGPRDPVLHSGHARMRLRIAVMHGRSRPRPGDH